MDATLNIIVRVAAQDAQRQLQSVAGAAQQVGGAGARAGQAWTGGMTSATRSLQRFLASLTAALRQHGLVGLMGMQFQRVAASAKTAATAVAGFGRNLAVATKGGNGLTFLANSFRNLTRHVRASSTAMFTFRSAMYSTQATMSTYASRIQAANKANSSFLKNMSSSRLIRYGKNLNWVGRQLAYNFTLPLALAGTALFKFNQDVTREMITVRKVYGDLSFSQQRVNEETDALAQSFQMLSTRFGVHQREVVEIAGLWASAGSAGRGLAENVRATLEAMILGNMDMEATTRALIAIQSTWRLSTWETTGGVSELTIALAKLNITENITGIRMEGLVQVFERAGGMARTAGVRIEELAAMAAALVPATGNATTAGNSLRTMISRLATPTTQTIALLEQIGFVVDSPEWLGKTVTGKVEALAEQWREMAAAQRAIAATVIAGRWQVNRFAVLMDDVASGVGYYNRVLGAMNMGHEELEEHLAALPAKWQENIRASDPENWAPLIQYYRELNQVLESSPRRWDIMTNAIRNQMADAFIPLMPTIMSVMQLFVQLAQKFNELPDSTRRWALIGLAALAIIGPVLSLVGAITQTIGLFVVLAKTLTFLVVGMVIPFIKAIFVASRMMVLLGKTMWVFFGVSAQLSKIFWALAIGFSEFLSKLWVTMLMGWDAAYKMAATKMAAASAWLSAFLSKVWVTMLLGWDALSRGMVALTAKAKVVMAALWGGFAAFMSKLWVTILLGWDLLNKAMLGLAGRAVLAVSAMWASFGSFLSKVWVTMLIAWDLIHKAMMAISAKSKLMIAVMWGGMGSFLSKVWVTMLIAWDALNKAMVLVSSRAMLAKTAIWGGFSAFLSKLWVTMLILWDKVAFLMGLIFSTRFGAGLLAGFKKLGGLVKVLGAGLLGIFKPMAVGLFKAIGAALVAVAGVLGIKVWVLVAIIAAVGVAIATIIKKGWVQPIIDFVKGVASAIWKLPEVFANALSSLVRVIASAVSRAVELLSYLNPFKRHSPSLVDNVTAGIDTILSQYNRLRQVPAIVARSLAGLADFRGLTQPALEDFKSGQIDNMIEEVGIVDPNMVEAARELGDNIMALYRSLPALREEILAQRAVVAQWTQALAEANAQVDKLAQKRDAIQIRFDSVSDQLDHAKSRLEELLEMRSEMAESIGAPAMSEYERQLLINQREQDKLNLRLIEFERAGHSVDEIRSKFAALNGEVEMLRGEQASLRAGGAGSEILGAYDEQIDKLLEQKGDMWDMVAEVEAIDKELARLDIENRYLEIMDRLSKPIDFGDGGEYKLPGGMSKEDLDAEIAYWDNIVKELQEEFDRLQEDLDNAQDALDEGTAARDDVQSSYDEEVERLRSLEEAYSSIEATIREMEEAMRDFADTNREAIEEARRAADEAGAAGAAAGGAAGRGDALDLFPMAEGIDYDIDGGSSTLGAEGDLFDIEQFNAELEAELEGVMASLGDMDLFESLEGSFDKLKGSIDRVVQWIREIPSRIAGIGRNILDAILVDPATAVWDWVNNTIIEPVANALTTGWEWINANIGGPAGGFFSSIGDALVGVWNSVISPTLEFMKTAFSTAGDVISWVWDNLIVRPIEFGAGLIKAAWDGIVLAVELAWVVIEPIWDAMYSFIDGYLKPIFEAFKVSAEIVWRLITMAISLAWQSISHIFGNLRNWISNILTGAWNTLKIVVDNVWSGIRLAASTAWDFMKGIFDFIKRGIETVADKFTWSGDMADTAWRKISEGLDWLKDRFDTVWGGIESVVGLAWSGLTTLFGTFTQILDPIFTGLRSLYNNVIKPIMSAIGQIFATAWNAAASTAAGAVNIFIKAFNAVATGINAIASLLGIDSRVTHMEEVSFSAVQFNFDSSGADALVNSSGFGGGGGGGGGAGGPLFMASGGILGAAGGAVNRARAIVGEGSDIHPEFVIPTDPTYRQRAIGLYSELGRTLGMDDGNSGGVFGGIGDFFSNGAGIVGDVIGGITGAMREAAVTIAWNPAKALAQGLINQIPVDFLRQGGTSILGAVDSWVRGVDSAWESERQRRIPPPPRAGAGSWRVIPQMLSQMGVPHKVLSTFRPDSITRNTGNQSWHALDRAIDLSGPTGMVNYSPNDLRAINHAIYAAYKPHLKELIYGGPGAKNVFRGQDHNFSNALMREHVNHVHAALARGGFVVPRTPGGSIFRIGEGLHDEAVQVTPLHGSDSQPGGKQIVVNINGNLSFPNITDPNDAEKFIKNLEVLAQ